MCKFLKLLVVAVVLFNIGCRGSHAIFCVTVDHQNVCFKREVWSFNGDKVWITEDKNVCGKPSGEKDFISNMLIDGNSFLYKIDGSKLYVFHDSFVPPRENFPVEVILRKYDPMVVDRETLLTEGYQEVDLGSEKMKSCFSDIF